VTTFPLKATGNGAYLEAHLDRASLPAAVTAKVRFARGGAEHRFDFTFQTLTSSPLAPSAATSRRDAASATSTSRTAPATGGSRSAARPKPPTAETGNARNTGGSSPATPQASSVETAPGPDPALVPLPIPDTVGGILEQLRARSQQVEALIVRGDFGAVWVPAFQAKDLAIALEARLDALTPSRRDAAAPALQQVVRLSWLLDAYGDVGNRQQLTDAYSAFSSAVTDVVSAFAETARP
jgi:hypothetical protein